MIDRKPLSTPTGQFQPIWPGDPEYLNKAELARRLGISIRSLDNLIRARRIPYVKLSGKLIRFPYAEVKEHLDRTCRVSARGEERGGSR